MVEILTSGRLIIGLNNQRMCLAGLFSEAERQSALVKFPRTLIDFKPRPGQKTGDTFAFWDLFDQKTLENVCADRITDKDATKTIKVPELFTAGGRALKAATAHTFTAQFILATVAAAPLRVIADRIIRWLSEQNAIALQLRIERDWQEHCLRKLAPGASLPWLEPDWIFHKIEKSLNSASRIVIYACCDEEDLMIDQDTLRRIALRRNIELLFKDDMPNSIHLPEFVTQRAMVDFTLCRSLGTYIGLMQSSFSRMIHIMNKLESGSQNLYFYDDLKMPMRKIG